MFVSMSIENIYNLSAHSLQLMYNSLSFTICVIPASSAGSSMIELESINSHDNDI